MCVCMYLQLARDDTTRSAARRHPLTSASVSSHGPQRGAHARFYFIFYFPLKFSRVSLGERHSIQFTTAAHTTTIRINMK